MAERVHHVHEEYVNDRRTADVSLGEAHGATHPLIRAENSLWDQEKSMRWDDTVVHAVSQPILLLARTIMMMTIMIMSS